MARKNAEERQEAAESLRALIAPGDTIYTILRHVSRSGMSRSISLYAIRDGKPRWLDGYAAKVTERALDRLHDGIKIGGCGMDMGFALVYNLSRALWPDGHTCIGEGCPSNDHGNGDRDYTPHLHADGGYALRHQWI